MMKKKHGVGHRDGADIAAGPCGGGGWEGGREIKPFRQIGSGDTNRESIGH